MNLIDTLSDITADLVEFEENEPFLRRLFNLEPGTWADVESLCEGLDSYQRQLQQLQNVFDERLRVTWMRYPASGYENRFCLILFFAEEELWNTVAVYNKQRLEQSIQQAEHSLLYRTRA